MSEIVPIFPTPVYKTKLDRDITIEEQTLFLDCSHKVMKNVGNYYSAQTGVLDLEGFANIKNFITDSINDYFDKIIKPEKNITPYISTSWINFTNKSEFHHPHNHPNSFISGVFYASVDPEKDSISFHSDLFRAIHIQSKENNEYNSSECTFYVSSGELLLFPSHLIHSVKPAEGDHTRISLAFNVFVRGELGSYSQLDGLIIS